MNQKILFFIIGLLVISSCVKDDLCIEPTTPTLIIRFYDNTDSLKVKNVSSLTVWAKGKDSIYSAEASLDSISLPLNINADETFYKLASGLIVDTLLISYERKDVFVSRSCGYKTVFENVSIASSTNNWIKKQVIINSTIENENSAHFNLYH